MTKINNNGDLCDFIDDNNICDGCCEDCFLGERVDTVILKGELEVVKECEHEWEYRRIDWIYYEEAVRTCNICGLEEKRIINDSELQKLFEG